MWCRGLFRDWRSGVYRVLCLPDIKGLKEMEPPILTREYSFLSSRKSLSVSWTQSETLLVRELGGCEYPSPPGEFPPRYLCLNGEIRLAWAQVEMELLSKLDASPSSYRNRFPLH